MSSQEVHILPRRPFLILKPSPPYPLRLPPRLLPQLLPYRLDRIPILPKMRHPAVRVLDDQDLPRVQQLVGQHEGAEGVGRGTAAVADDMGVGEGEAEGAECVDARVHAGYDGVVLRGGGGGERVGGAGGAVGGGSGGEGGGVGGIGGLKVLLDWCGHCGVDS